MLVRPTLLNAVPPMLSHPVGMVMLEMLVPTNALSPIFFNPVGKTMPVTPKLSPRLKALSPMAVTCKGIPSPVSSLSGIVTKPDMLYSGAVISSVLSLSILKSHPPVCTSPASALTGIIVKIRAKETTAANNDDNFFFLLCTFLHPCL